LMPTRTDGVGMDSSIMRTLAADGAATVTVLGEVDFSNACELSECLRAAVAEWAPEVLRVDLGQASFIDSTGLGALIDGYRAAGEADVRFLVANPTPNFRRVLTVTGLNEFFGLSGADEIGGSAPSTTKQEATQATGA
jgi:anti-sigma B factor antagonist